MVQPVQDSTKIIHHSDGEYYLDVGDGNVDSVGTGDVQLGADIKGVLDQLQGAGLASGSAWTLQEIKASITGIFDEGNVSISNAADWDTVAQKLADTIQKLQQAQLALDRVPTDKPELKKMMQEIVNNLKTEAKNLFIALEQHIPAGDSGRQTKLDTFKTNLGRFIPEYASRQTPPDRGPGTTPPPDPNAHQTRPGARAAAQPKAFDGMMANGGGGGWMAMNTAYSGAQTGGFPMDAYLQSMWMDKASLQGYEDALKQRSEQKQMMMLFFYFVKMAMSGDLGAMYRFMQFITYIISKDKAMMNIYMAHMLIENENAQREALEEWLGKGTPDANDQNSVYEWQAGLQKLNSIQSSLGMSQKLIANMMEEMAQIVEALMGMTKSALDANGRVLQRLTRG